MIFENVQKTLEIAQQPPLVPFGRDDGILSGDRGPDINIGLSVLKREAQSITDVVNQLERNGWSRTRTVGDDRLVYLENNGINITAIRGPMGTVIIPSGPVRGRLFGENVELVSRGEGEGIIPRGPIRSRAQEMMEQQRGFSDSGPAERPAENRPGPRHTESDDVLL